MSLRPPRHPRPFAVKHDGRWIVVGGFDTIENPRVTDDASNEEVPPSLYVWAVELCGQRARPWFPQPDPPTMPHANSREVPAFWSEWPPGTGPHAPRARRRRRPTEPTKRD